MVPPDTLSDRYSRQTLFFPNGQHDQARLNQARVALVGCGALGTVIAGLLVRAGVGFLRIVDRDFLELSNLQRQTLFDEDDVREALPKAVAAARKLGRVNAEVIVEAAPNDLAPDTVDRLLGDVSLVLDGTDNFETRYLINDYCVRERKPWIYSAVVASYGVTMTVLPERTPCLRCIFPAPVPSGSAATCDTAGVIGPIGGVIGSLAVAEALKLLIGATERLRPGLFWLDVWNNTVQETPLSEPVPGCRTCQERRFDYLEASAARPSATLCGRSAVQVRPLGPRLTVRFDELGPRLAQVGRVVWNDHLLRFSADNVDLTLFPDARAIIKGTDDPVTARALYARYIGS
jgi:molybdopterin/thiamine biosynthesis adenylyltransferase